MNPPRWPKIVHRAAHAKEHVDRDDAEDVDQPPLAERAKHLALAIKERQLRADEAKDRSGRAG